MLKAWVVVAMPGVADRLQHAARGLRHRADAGLVVDRRLRRLHRRAGHARQGRHPVWFGWHRTTQLPDYAVWLAGTRGKIADSITAPQVCRLWDEGRRLLDPAIDRAC
jgi:hypothetical protein